MNKYGNIKHIKHEKALGVMLQETVELEQQW